MSMFRLGRLESLRDNVDTAIGLAESGRPTDGWACLERALAHAEEARREGQPWGEELATCYRQAMERYADRFPVLHTRLTH